MPPCHHATQPWCDKLAARSPIWRRYALSTAGSKNRPGSVLCLPKAAAASHGVSLSKRSGDSVRTLTRHLVTAALNQIRKPCIRLQQSPDWLNHTYSYTVTARRCDSEPPSRPLSLSLSLSPLLLLSHYPSPWPSLEY